MRLNLAEEWRELITEDTNFIEYFESGLLETLFPAFLYVKMIYELIDGKIIELGEGLGQENIECTTQKMYVHKLDTYNMLVINTMTNRCVIIPKEQKKISKEIVDLLNTYDNKTINTQATASFIIAITYSCNLKCTYCYQQHDKNLDKRLIAEAKLKEIFEIILKYKEMHPEKSIDIGIFGGEPLLVSNEKVIDDIFEFCKNNRFKVHITTNGCNLEYYLKKIIIYRNFISGINPTIDSMKLNYVTRHSLDSSYNNDEETEKLIKCLKTLLYYGVPVNLATNVDRHNYDKIDEILNNLYELELMYNDKFHWYIGRVDDRLYETGYKDIIFESDIIEMLLKKNIVLPQNAHIAFLKTTYNLVNKMGYITNQEELKGLNNYCWTSSNFDNVFYIDSNMKTYRCTYTVGRPQRSIFDFTLENLIQYKIPQKNSNSYEECENCDIGGYCGGGCQLSHSVNFGKCCDDEKKNFEQFMDRIFIPYINNILSKREE